MNSATVLPQLAALLRAGFTLEEAQIKVLGITGTTKDKTFVGREMQRMHAIAVTIDGARVDDICSETNNFEVTLEVNNVDETVRVITERGSLGMINHREFGVIHYFEDEETTQCTHKQQLVNVLRGKEPCGDDDDDDPEQNPDAEIRGVELDALR
jgi:hypothetical protein